MFVRPIALGFLLFLLVGPSGKIQRLKLAEMAAAT